MAKVRIINGGTEKIERIVCEEIKLADRIQVEMSKEEALAVTLILGKRVGRDALYPTYSLFEKLYDALGNDYRDFKRNHNLKRENASANYQIVKTYTSSNYGC